MIIGSAMKDPTSLGKNNLSASTVKVHFLENTVETDMNEPILEIDRISASFAEKP